MGANSNAAAHMNTDAIPIPHRIRRLRRCSTQVATYGSGGIWRYGRSTTQVYAMKTLAASAPLRASGCRRRHVGRRGSQRSDKASAAKAEKNPLEGDHGDCRQPGGVGLSERDELVEEASVHHAEGDPPGRC